MDTSTPFTWRHFQAEIILLCVRGYLRYPLSYRGLEEMMIERGLHSDHTTIYLCWLLRISVPKLGSKQSNRKPIRIYTRQLAKKKIG